MVKCRHPELPRGISRAHTAGKMRPKGCAKVHHSRGEIDSHRAGTAGTAMLSGGLAHLKKVSFILGIGKVINNPITSELYGACGVSSFKWRSSVVGAWRCSRGPRRGLLLFLSKFPISSPPIFSVIAPRSSYRVPFHLPSSLHIHTVPFKPFNQQPFNQWS